MYAWRAPMVAEMIQSAIAHFPPRAMIDPQRPMSRNPGLASPMTNPSHQRIVLRRRRSSTATSAMHPPLDRKTPFAGFRLWTPDRSATSQKRWATLTLAQGKFNTALRRAKLTLTNGKERHGGSDPAGRVHRGRVASGRRRGDRGQEPGDGRGPRDG